MSATTVHLPARRRFGALRDVGNGIVAVAVKELRGRMRGRRAFAILTVYLVLVGGFAWMTEALQERTVAAMGGTAFSASAEIGRQVFTWLLMLQTLLVLMLAPASTAGAISLEREKQTLDMLATTPISSLAIVLGKLFSALAWVLLLLLAGIPVTALVFTFGGVAPDDVVRGYAVLLVTAVFFGTIGLFVSSVVRRTPAATVITFAIVGTLTLGTFFVHDVWSGLTGNTPLFLFGTAGGGVVVKDDVGFRASSSRPPEAMLYLNPFVPQLDVVCGTESSFGPSCSVVSAVTARNLADIGFDGAQFGVARDRFWPRSVAAMVILSLVLILLSVQLVTPTRRWRLRLPRPRRRREGNAA